MRRILFHLGHPAHFHLFKNVIFSFKEKGYKITIVIKKKDILEKLLVDSGLSYINILPEGRKETKIGIAIGQIKQDLMLLKFCLKQRPDIMVGTSVAISHVGRLLGIPSINVNEDDAEVVPLYAKLSYPWASVIIAPEVCSVGKWKKKKISYSGYHELAYLHPNNFAPDSNVVSKYISPSSNYFIIRFAKLGAHHDFGISGINNSIALKLIEILNEYGKIIITSERVLPPELEKYRMNINPLDMHHVMAFASIYIGDSQTMAAEAGVLGTPFIRFNDFVGRISYLDELENKYKLGFGIKTEEINGLYTTLINLIKTQNLKEEYKKRRKRMLNEKIDLSLFLSWFIENYPSSVKIVQKEPEYQDNFKMK